MANVMMAFGGLMLVAGLYGVVSGARIIQIEEGWASVIAGATLIAGGAVTVGLGLVMRLLRRLTTALVDRAGAPAVETAAPEAPHLAAPLDDDIFRDEPQYEPPSPAIAERIEDASAVPDMPEIVPSPPPALAPAPPRKPAKIEAPAPVIAPPPEPIEAEAPPQHHSEDAVHPADDYKLETPSSPEHDLPQAEPKREPAPSLPRKPSKEADWLDQALAQLDEEMPIRAATRQVEAAPPGIAAKPAEPPPRHEPEPAPNEPVPQEPVPPVPTSAVIGRYEADGTSYIMYADGSIEAQSDAGVFRFASMAELKSHIEG